MAGDEADPSRCGKEERDRQTDRQTDRQMWREREGRVKEREIERQRKIGKERNR